MTPSSTIACVFSAQFAQLQQQGIEFVVASGNQYYQLIFFPGNSRADLFCRRERCAGVRTRPTAVPRRADRHESPGGDWRELLKDRQLNFVACGLESLLPSATTFPDAISSP